MVLEAAECGSGIASKTFRSHNNFLFIGHLTLLLLLCIIILPHFLSNVNRRRRAASVTLDPKRAGEPPDPKRGYRSASHPLWTRCSSFTARVSSFLSGSMTNKTNVSYEKWDAMLWTWTAKLIWAEKPAYQAFLAVLFSLIFFNYNFKLTRRDAGS